ncbi:MAG: ABC transporter permease [Ruminococcaceae bacterium]|nr:ABC transporter permease [Oscillospiraceae bacterium]NLC73330.1 ABC transporter permease [Oscillospiraceae bacterium]
MKSKTSFFNKAVFNKTVKRFWPVWAVYLFIWLLITVPALVGFIQNSQTATPHYSFEYETLIVNMFKTGATLVGAVMAFVFAALSAMLVYGSLYNSSSADALGSLPLKRSSIFISLTAAALVPLFIANLIVFLTCLTIEAAYGFLMIESLLIWLAAVTLMNIGFFGIAAICAQFTGNILIFPAFYLIANFFAVVVETFVNLFLTAVYYGFLAPDKPKTIAFSPIVNILNLSFIGTNLAEPFAERNKYIMYLLIFAAVGIVFIVVSALLFRKRRLESAGDTVAVKALYPIFKYALSFGSALVIGMGVYSVAFGRFSINGFAKIFALCLCTCLSACIAYCVAEILLTKNRKSLRVKKTWRNILSVCAVCLIIVVSLSLDVFGFQRRLPAKDEIEKVTVAYLQWNSTLTEEDSIELARVAHKEILEEYAEKGQSSDPGMMSFRIIYSLKNGRTEIRKYMVSQDNKRLIIPIMDVLNSEEATRERIAIGKPGRGAVILEAEISYGVTEKNENGESVVVYYNKSFSASEAKDLYENYIKKDAEHENIGKVQKATNYNCTISILYRWYSPADRTGKDFEVQRIELSPDTGSEYTLKWLKEHGIVPILTEQGNSTAIPAKG